jgi:hypothetical protein
MHFIDRKYLLLTSVYLEGWKDSGNDIYRFRCPFCGDSKKSKRKTRGYFFPVDDTTRFKCHNCGSSYNLHGFLKEIAPDLAAQFRFEKFSNGNQKFEKKKEVELDPKRFATETAERLNETSSFLSPFTRIFALDEDHPARQYLSGRLIPKEHQRKLFYVESIRDVAAKIPGYEDRWLPDLQAILIPFYDEEGVLTYCQCRAIDDDAPIRYITFEISPGLKVWGLENVDWNKEVYITEGPFDAMFIENGIAVAGASLLSILKYLRENAKSFVFVFDKDYQENYQVFHQLKSAIDQGCKVVLYDKHFVGKDINKTVELNKWNVSDLMRYIESRTYYGLQARLGLSDFKKPQEERQANSYGKSQNRKAAANTKVPRFDQWK